MPPLLGVEDVTYVNNYEGYAPESIEKTFHKIRRGVLIFFIIIAVVELFFVVFGT